jgi:Copper type II ascorbate-dependent monooxygenase, C-terminal domain
MQSISPLGWFCFGSALVFIGCVSSHDTALPAERSANAGSKTSAGAGAGTGGIAIGTGEFAPPEVEFNFDVHVPAGSELLRCMYAAFPTDHGVVAVAGAESHYTVGSHHMLAYRSSLIGVPDGQTGVWDCQDGAWQRDERGSYYEAQQPDEHRELPDGIAHKFQPGEVLILQAHYINTTETDLEAHVQLKLHTVDVRTVQQEAGTIYFNDENINIPPHARAGTTMTCPLGQDINLALLWSHMHQRGVHFVATTDDPGAAEALGTLYDGTDWSEPKERSYPNDESAELHAGSHITFSCEYQNDSDNTYVFGNSAATNEMCILHGMYWPRMPTIMEQCFLGTSSRTPM